MELHTPQAIRAIRSSSYSYAVFDGKKQCKLLAMARAWNFHTLTIDEVNGELRVFGRQPVVRNNKFLLV